MYGGRACLRRPSNGVYGILPWATCLLRRHWTAGLTGHQKTVAFINNEAASVHANLRLSSIYTGESGEWKLGGFEVLSATADEDGIVHVCEIRVATLSYVLIVLGSHWSLAQLHSSAYPRGIEKWLGYVQAKSMGSCGCLGVCKPDL